MAKKKKVGKVDEADEAEADGLPEDGDEGDEAQEGPARAGGAKGAAGRFPFMANRATGYLISLCFLAVALLSLGTKGFNYGIDFRGGSVYRYRFPDASKATTEEVRKRLTSPEMADRLGPVVVQKVDKSEQVDEVAAANSVEFLIFTGFKEKDAKDDPMPSLEARFQADFGGAVRLQATEIGPTIGETIRVNALKALLLAVLGMLVYIWARFEFRWGVAAVIALVHDVTITLGVFSIFQREVTSDSLAALLTIVGYSLNDTIVVMDRVRENLGSHQLKRRLGFEGVMNLSVNQSLSRTLNTSFTTLIPVVALLLFGGTVIKDFALALLVGVVSGTYSSIWVVAALLVDWYYRDHPGMAEKSRAKATT